MMTSMPYSLCRRMAIPMAAGRRTNDSTDRVCRAVTQPVASAEIRLVSFKNTLTIVSR